MADSFRQYHLKGKLAMPMPGDPRVKILSDGDKQAVIKEYPGKRVTSLPYAPKPKPPGTILG